MRKKLSKIFPLANVNFALFILRAGIALLMLTHAYPKVLNLFGDEPVKFISFFGLSATVTISLVLFAEFICSVLVFIGLFTRLAVIPLITTMLVAVFHFHADDPFAVKEKAILYLLVYTAILLTGAGKFSVDYFISGKKGKK